jgi:nucleotide-binding universal stress UspA family protein
VPKEASYAGFKVAVFGNDYKEDVSKEMKNTYTLVSKYNARLDVVSVEPGRENYTQEVICEEGGIREVSVWAETVAEGLQTYMNNEKASLLVLKHHSRNFIQELFQKSTTKELLKESTIPLYIYK